MDIYRFHKWLWRASLLVTVACMAQQAQAVPSFARQTGMACNACHTVAPQLNAFGRYFKLHGYVLGTSKLSGGSSQLSIDQFPPLSAMLILSDTQTKAAQPASLNAAAQFPQQLSIFYAGAIAEKMGAFAQITYTQPSDHFTMDNTDIRYASDVNWDSGQTMVWGLTLNNNPSVQDVWNSTPAWGYRFISSSVAPNPSAAPLLVGALAQNVAGLGAYAWLNNTWYGEVTMYRSAQPGVSPPYNSTNSNVISGYSPYYRFAWEHPWASGDGQSDLEVGILGMTAHRFPGNGKPLSGPTDNYTDTGADIQYQYITATDSFALHGNYIHEQEDLNASSALGASNPSDNLNYWNINASYYWNETYGPTLGYFSTAGSSDALLYALGAVTGSATGSPNTNGWIAQWTYLPALNVQLTAQYIIYSKFNGGSNNYDGNGRSASDNDTLYLALWVLW